MMVRSIHFGWSTLFALGTIAIVLFFTKSPLAMISESYGHFDHLPMYNGRNDLQSRYNVFQALGSDYARPKEPTTMIFSIQDLNGNDATDVSVMIEVYTSEGDRIKTFAWTKYSLGDFEVPLTFPHAGTYQVVLSTADGPVRLGSEDPVREILGSTSGCSCDRSVFNISISEGFGTIWNSAMMVAAGGALAIVGGVLAMSYKKRIKSARGSNPVSTLELVRYSVMLSAIAGGIVHLAIYVGHASLRIEYSIFLVIAGLMQISYGCMYVLLNYSGVPQKEFYRKSLGINLFGLIGTAILVGLYTYTIVLPAPLSPTNMPDRVEIAGVLAKSLEIFLLVGVLYVMLQEKRQARQHLENKS